MVVASCLALTFALTIFFFLPIHPSDVGVEIEEVSQSEDLIPSAKERNQGIKDTKTKNITELAEVEGAPE
jgi:hypothetical protein